MALNASNCSNLEQLALKGLKGRGVDWLHFAIQSARMSEIKNVG